MQSRSIRRSGQPTCAIALVGAHKHGFNGSESDGLAHYADYSKNVDLWANWPSADAETAARSAPRISQSSLGALRGKNLACWCKLGDRCHADVLLKLANAESPIDHDRSASVR
jgi:hypothetical protein